MKKLFVGNLHSSIRETELVACFSEFGTVRNIKLVMDYSWNHTGITFWAWRDILEKGAASEYSDWYEIESFELATETEGAGPAPVALRQVMSIELPVKRNCLSDYFAKCCKMTKRRSSLPNIRKWVSF